MVEKEGGVPRRWLNEDEQKLWRAYLGSFFRLTKVLNNDLENFAGFDMLTYEILVYLSESKNREMRMKTLSYYTNAQKSRLTYRIKQLEEQGLVVRKSTIEDGRGSLCQLTDKGFEVLRNTAPIHVEGVLTNFTEPTSSDNLMELIKLFDSIAPNIEQGPCEQG
jgi:DNA-binding MarR family transcriptional regulator